MAAKPIFAFGDVIENSVGHKGRIEAMFRNYHCAVQCGFVPRDWWETQTHRPSTKEQVFYLVTSDNLGGAILLGEEDVVSLQSMRGGAG
jgi:hypothetical protein